MILESVYYSKWQKTLQLSKKCLSIPAYLKVMGGFGLFIASLPFAHKSGARP